MITLDLVNVNNSDIKYRKTMYNNQPNIEFLNELSDSEVKVITRLSDAFELLTLLFVTEWLKSKRKKVHLYAPYIFCTKTDKRWSPMHPFPLKVIAKILASQDYESITTCDVHSEMANMLIENLVDEGCPFLYEDLINKLNHMPYLLIADSKESLPRVRRMSAIIGYQGPIIYGEKRMDEQGRVVDYYLNNPGEIRNNGRLLPIIVSDICDDGKSIAILANTIGNYTVTNPALVVTHGLFTDGFDMLIGRFDKIFTTNSASDVYAKVMTSFPDADTKNFKKEHNEAIRKRFFVTDVFAKAIEIEA